MITYHCVNAETDNQICLSCKYSGYVAEKDTDWSDEDFCEWLMLIPEEEI